MKKIFVFTAALSAAAAFVGCSGEVAAEAYAFGLGLLSVWIASFLGFAVCKAVAYWATLTAEQTIWLQASLDVFRWVALLPWALYLWIRDKVGARKDASSR